MNWLEQFDKYIGVQGVLALGVTAAVITMVVKQTPVPAELWSLLGVGWGFYFAKNGSKIVSNAVKRAQKG